MMAMCSEFAISTGKSDMRIVMLILEQVAFLT